MYDLPDSKKEDSRKKKSQATAGLPSPRSSARLCQARLQELRATLPGASENAASQEDSIMSGSGIDGPPHEHRKKDMGIGAVIMDPPLRSQFGLDDEHSNAYAAWQLRRQAVTPSPTSKPVPGDAMLAHMGLFNRLPGELRNRIYRLALLEPDGPYTITMQPGTCGMGPCTHAKLTIAVPGILSTCRQIRQEAFIIFCAENTAIKFDHHTVRNRCTANFLRAIGPYASKIPKVILEIMVWQASNGNNNNNNGREGVGHSKEIVISCPSGVWMEGASLPRFEAQFDSKILTKEKKACKRLSDHLEQLNGRVGTAHCEELLLEWVWSDFLADLVWRCQKWW